MYHKRYDIIVKKYYIYIDIIQFRGIVIPAIPYDKKCTKKRTTPSALDSVVLLLN